MLCQGDYWPHIFPISPHSYTRLHTDFWPHIWPYTHLPYLSTHLHLTAYWLLTWHPIWPNTHHSYLSTQLHSTTDWLLTWHPIWPDTWFLSGHTCSLGYRVTSDHTSYISTHVHFVGHSYFVHIWAVISKMAALFCNMSGLSFFIRLFTHIEQVRYTRCCS